MPSAPISIGALASHGSLAAIRAKGTQGVPDVATIIACAEARSMGPCSRSTMIQSSPQAAMIRTVWTLGMVAMAPKVGRLLCHCWRKRLSGFKVEDIGGEDMAPQNYILLERGGQRPAPAPDSACAISSK